MGILTKSVAAASLGLTLSACGALTPMTPEERLAYSVKHFNSEAATAEMDKQLPGSKMAARVDNGDTLVLMVTNVPTGNRTFDPNTLRKVMRPTLCDDRDFRQLMEDGINVRFELTSNFGKELPAVQFARCG